MSIVGDKKNVFTTLGALSSTKDIVKKSNSVNSLSSVNNKKEVMPFLLDVLSSMVGAAGIALVVGKMLSETIDTIEPKLKESLKKQFIGINSNKLISQTSFGFGVNVNVNKVDLYGKLKQSPSGNIGELLYGTNPNSFDHKAFESISTNGNEVTVANNTTLTYDSSSDSFTAKPVNSSMTVGDFTNNYIDSLILIDKKQFTANVLNSLFGTLTSNTNKSVDSILNELLIDETLNKYLSDSTSKTLTDSEISKLQQDAENLKDGLAYVDVGCGLLPNSVTLESLSGCVETISNTTNSLTVIGALNDLVDSGFNNSSSANKNDETIKDGFNRKLVNVIQTNTLKSTTTSISIKTLQAIVDDINNKAQNSSNVDQTNANGDMIQCMSKTVLNNLNKVIFDGVKKEVKAIMIPVTKKIAKEKINQYLGLMKSLTGFGNI